MSFDPLSFGHSFEQGSDDVPITVEADTWSYADLGSPTAPSAPLLVVPVPDAGSSMFNAQQSTSSSQFASAMQGSAMQGSAVSADPLSASSHFSGAPQAQPQQLTSYPQLPTYAPLAIPTFDSGSGTTTGGVEPPHAYNGTTFSPMGRQASTSVDALSGHPTSPGVAPARLVVTVQAPSTHRGPSSLPGSGLEETFMAYQVATQTSLPNYANSHALVTRRFRDFVALADTLQYLYPGYFIPPRPNRNAIEGRRMKPQFLEARRAALERYLNRLAAHGVLGQGHALQLFLESPGELRENGDWLALQPRSVGVVRSTTRLLRQLVGRERTVPSPQDATVPARASGDLYRMMHESLQQLQGMRGVKPQLSGSEVLLRDEAAKMEECRKSLLKLSQKVDAWLGCCAARHAVTEELGSAFARLGAYEGVSHRSPGEGRAEAAAAEGLVKVSKLQSLTSDHAAKHLALLHDYVAHVPANAVALDHRERVLLTVLTLGVDLDRCKEAVEKASGPDSNGSQKVEALRHQAAQLAAAQDSARNEYNAVLERNAGELATFKSHMRRDMRDMLKEFALVQIVSAQKSSSMWSDVAQSIGSA